MARYRQSCGVERLHTTWRRQGDGQTQPSRIGEAIGESIRLKPRNRPLESPKLLLDSPLWVWQVVPGRTLRGCRFRDQNRHNPPKRRSTVHVINNSVESASALLLKLSRARPICKPIQVSIRTKVQLSSNQVHDPVNQCYHKPQFGQSHRFPPPSIGRDGRPGARS